MTGRWAIKTDVCVPAVVTEDSPVVDIMNNPVGEVDVGYQSHKFIKRDLGKPTLRVVGTRFVTGCIDTVQSARNQLNSVSTLKVYFKTGLHPLFKERVDVFLGLRNGKKHIGCVARDDVTPALLELCSKGEVSILMNVRFACKDLQDLRSDYVNWILS